MDAETLRELRDLIAERLQGLEEYFNDDVVFTFLARNTKDDKASLLVTADPNPLTVGNTIRGLLMDSNSIGIDDE